MTLGLCEPGAGTNSWKGETRWNGKKVFWEYFRVFLIAIKDNVDILGAGIRCSCTATKWRAQRTKSFFFRSLVFGAKWKFPNGREGRKKELATHSIAGENERLTLHLSSTSTAQRIYQRLCLDWAHQAIGFVHCAGSQKKKTLWVNNRRLCCIQYLLISFDWMIERCVCELERFFSFSTNWCSPHKITSKNQHFIVGEKSAYKILFI